MNKNGTFGKIIALSIAMVGATLIGPSNINFVYADANCDKAGVGQNDAGNNRGNSKQCGFGGNADGPKEPVRNCESPNIIKDNDGDDDLFCKFRPSP